MRRRDLLAGLASAGTLGGAALVATGTPIRPASLGGSGVDPVTLETIPAPGSRDGETTIPAPDRPTFVDFFGTWCPPCAEQMPDLRAANDRIGDEVHFVSVTTEGVGWSVTEDEVADWWIEHDGNWPVAADPSAELAARLDVGGYPTAVTIDAAGRVRWSDTGVHTADDLVEAIRTVTGE